jgi:hypothetical protein
MFPHPVSATIVRILCCCAQVQGGILNFEVLRPDGSVFSYKTFEREAAEAGFHVRTGAECNPGACYNYLGVQVGGVGSSRGGRCRALLCWAGVCSLLHLCVGLLVVQALSVVAARDAG